MVQKPEELDDRSSKPGGPEMVRPVVSDILDQTALDMLLDLIGGERKYLVELVDSFLEEAPPLLSKLHQAMEQEDALGVRMAAHTLKSSSNDFGATALATMCQELEDLGKAGELAGIAERVAQIEAEYGRVKVALEALRDGETHHA